MTRCAAFLLFSAALVASPACAAQGRKPFEPAGEPPMAVRANAAGAKLPDGTTVAYAAQTLTFQQPETRQMSLESPVPSDYADWMAPWQPWPGKLRAGGVAALSLKPNNDENGTLILGGLFRQIMPESIKVTSADGAKTFTAGQDFRVNTEWGQIVGLGNRLGIPNKDKIKVAYGVALQRIDLVQIDRAGKLTVKKGASRLVCPYRPDPDPGQAALAGVYICPWKQNDTWSVTVDNILPIDPAPPVRPINRAAVARTIAKLRAGKTVKLAYLGASTTLGAEAGRWWDDDSKTWRGLTTRGVRKRFPDATVEEVAAYKGGEGTPFGVNTLEEKVIPAKADLVFVMLGLNDASSAVGREPRHTLQQYKQDMDAIVKRAKAAGMDVIVVIGMQYNPFHPNKTAERWIGYRQAQLDVAKDNDVAAADVYTEWINLSTRGIPPYSQLHNWINHPGIAGHQLFADVLLRFFDED